MENTAKEQTVSEKQKQFTEGVKFRIGTERTSAKRYFYQPATGRIVDTIGNEIGDVLEIASFSIKLRYDILGTPQATYIRFEYIIFDKP
jgi:hypothetical protein